VFLTNWKRAAFENVYLDLDRIPSPSNQDGIHVQGPGQFLSIRNLQGHTWDDMIALNADDLGCDWDGAGRFVRRFGRNYGPHRGFGPVTDVDIDGVQADDCPQVIRIQSRASRVDRVSIRNVRGTYRDFGVWITPYFREGGNLGRIEFENIDLRPTGPRAYDYFPPFLFFLAGGIEQLLLRNVSANLPSDDRPLVWVQPDAKIGLLRLQGLDVCDPRRAIGCGPLIRADGRIGMLQLRDVVVRRPAAAAPAGSLLATGGDRSALKAFMDARAAIVNPGDGWRGWPEGRGHLESAPRIERLQLADIAAGGLEHVLDHRAGTIDLLDLERVAAPGFTRVIGISADAKIGEVRGAIPA
jgi:hypothetical protein